MEIRSHVIDIGCGVGTWLNSAQKLGAKTILGIEGHWLENDLAVVDKKFVKTQDFWKIEFRSSLSLIMYCHYARKLQNTFTEMRADSFIDDLCALSDLILFSAAIRQSGRQTPC